MSWSEQQGFTLIEALLTLLVISFGFLAIARLQLNIWRNHLDGLQNNEAVQLLDTKLNELSQASSIVLPIKTNSHDTVDTALTTYSRSWKHEKSPHAKHTLHVEINWNTSKGVKTLSLTTVTYEQKRSQDGGFTSRFD